MAIKMFRHWYRCNGDHLMQWTKKAPSRRIHLARRAAFCLHRGPVRT